MLDHHPPARRRRLRPRGKVHVDVHREARPGTAGQPGVEREREIASLAVGDYTRLWPPASAIRAFNPVEVDEDRARERAVLSKRARGRRAVWDPAVPTARTSAQHPGLIRSLRAPFARNERLPPSNVWLVYEPNLTVNSRARCFSRLSGIICNISSSHLALNLPALFTLVLPLLVRACCSPSKIDAHAL